MAQSPPKPDRKRSRLVHLRTGATLSAHRPEVRARSLSICALRLVRPLALAGGLRRSAQTAPAGAVPARRRSNMMFAQLSMWRSEREVLRAVKADGWTTVP